MGSVAYAMRLAWIEQQICQLNLKQMDLAQKSQDLSIYGMNISDGIITPEEAINAPGGIFFGAQFEAAKMCHNAAVPMAQARMQMYVQQQQQMAQTGTIDPAQLQVNNNFVFSGILRSALEHVARGMQKRVAIEENKIQQEKIKIETKLKALTAERDSLERALEQDSKRSAPKYM